MRWLTNFYDFSFKWTATAPIGVHPTNAWLSQLVNFKNAIWTWGHFRRTICNKILCSEIRKKEVVMTAGRWWSWSIQILQLLMLWWPVMKAGSIAMTNRPRDRVLSGSMLALPDPRMPDRANPPTDLIIPFFESSGMIYMHCIPTGQTVNKEYYVEVLREFRKRFHWERPAVNRVSGISTRAMCQSTTPSLSQTIWPRWASRPCSRWLLVIP